MAEIDASTDGYAMHAVSLPVKTYLIHHLERVCFNPCHPPTTFASALSDKQDGTMQASPPDVLHAVRNLFLDFIDAATASGTDEATDASAHELLAATRAELRGLDDDTLVLIAARAQDSALARAAIRLTAS
ncbi:hypothetical protein ACLFKT_22975, partial [Paraburkholderia sp. BR14261]